MNKHYSLDDLKPIIAGEIPLPNFREENLSHLVNNIAACGHSMRAEWGWAYQDGQRKQWAQFFLTPNAMGNANSGGFDGGGYVMIYSSRKEGPIVGRFMICQHTVVEGAGANHSRGWHPGSCSKCGLDMTVDSGD